MNRSLGVKLWTGYATYHFARCLARSDRSLGEVGMGQAALQEVIDEAEALGMTRLLRQASALRESLLKIDADSLTEAEKPKIQEEPREVYNMTTVSGDAKVETVQFYEEDETCVLGFSGRKVRVRKSKGLELMRTLILEPGREFHVVDLGRANGANGHNGQMAQLVDGGPMLDAPAKQSYRLRLQDLREEREEAEKFNDLARVSRIEEEINFLARELARAIGLKGNDRKAFSDTERARVRVTQAIRSTIRKIAKHDTSLGWYLDKAIKTGSFCCYRPAPLHGRELRGPNGSNPRSAQ